MKSPKHLVLRSRCHVHCSIRSRGVIRHHRSLASGRRQPGQHGRHTLTLRTHYSLFRMILRSWRLDSIHMARLERWTVVMYNKSSGCSGVNDVGRQLFTHGTRTLNHIPPHRKRCFNMQSELYTRQVTSGDKQGSDTKMSRMLQRGVGRKTVNTKLWVPFWTVLDDASKACALLHHCGCGKACRGNCICARAGINSLFCVNCEGGCINNDGV